MKKTIVLLTRKPGTSFEQFKQHYETVHAPGAIERIPALARADYRRNFIESASVEGSPLPDFDVITEITFADDADHAEFQRSLSDPAVQAWIAEDEARFSNRALTRSYTVTEYRSA
jgi:uncharacterized protein (TIGR02118 family)